MVKLVPLASVPEICVEALLDAAFGGERRTRTAYRVRKGTIAQHGLSFAAFDAGASDGAAPDGATSDAPAQNIQAAPRLVATLQCWPVELACDAGDTHPLIMVGPVAVLPARQRDGIGKMLMMHMLATAHQTGADPALMLIGDPEYYERFFGFSALRTGGWRLPGPVEQRRVLARGADVPACAGVLRARAAPHI